VTRSTRGIGIRAAVLCAAGLGTALLISGCGAGQISQTADMQPAVPGANSTVAPGADNAIQLRNVLLAYPGVDGYRQGATAPLLLHIFNTGQKQVRLVQVTTDAAATVSMRGSGAPAASASPSESPSPSESASASPSESPSPSESASPSGSPSESPSASPFASASPTESAVPGGRPVSVTVPVGSYITLSATSGTTLQLEGLTRSLRAGEAVTMTFVFDNGAEYTLDVPVGLPTAPAPRGSAVIPEGEAPHVGTGE
jgi:copper(I)-binding protein